MVQAVCGNGAQEPGETCDDGNTSNNDPCPADCVIDACAQTTPTRQVRVNFDAPPAQTVAGMTVLLDYPEGKVIVPGSGGHPPSGSVPVTVITGLPAGAVGNINDFEHVFREVVASGSGFPEGQLFVANFESCQGATAPSAGEFTCTVLDASDAFGLDVVGVTCTVEVL
jgi:cysteine-rich repeat protein